MSVRPICAFRILEPGSAGVTSFDTDYNTITLRAVIGQGLIPYNVGNTIAISFNFTVILNAASAAHIRVIAGSTPSDQAGVIISETEVTQDGPLQTQVGYVSIDDIFVNGPVGYVKVFSYGVTGGAGSGNAKLQDPLILIQGADCDGLLPSNPWTP